MGFRVGEEAEATISAVRKFLESDTNRVLMQGDMSNTYGSINRLAVLKAVRKHIPCFAPLCASQFVRYGTVAVLQERDGSGEKSELHDSAEQRNLLLDILEQDAGSAGTSERRSTCDGLHLVCGRHHVEP